MRGRRLAVATTVAACLATGGQAGATSPFLTDPAGDATGPASPLQPLFVPPLPSDPSVDIVSADVAAVDGALELSITVVELSEAAPADFDGRRFYYSINHGGGRLTADFDIGPGYQDLRSTYYAASSGSAEVPVSADYDVTADTVTLTFDLDDLNAAIDSASGGRDNLVRSGSRLHSVSTQTYYSKTLTIPAFDQSYPAGLYNTDIAGSEDTAVYEVP